MSALILHRNLKVLLLRPVYKYLKVILQARPFSADWRNSAGFSVTPQIILSLLFFRGFFSIIPFMVQPYCHHPGPFRRGVRLHPHAPTHAQNCLNV